MSTGHHGTGPDDRGRIDDVLKRLVAQGDGTAKRTYPEGRLGAADEGELAFAVGADERHGTVVLHFNKPVVWMGMSPADAVRMAEKLIEMARALSTEPLTINLTRVGPMIIVLFTCELCDLKDKKVEIRFRRPDEDVLHWTEHVKGAVSRCHKAARPRCKARRAKEIKIPEPIFDGQGIGVDPAPFVAKLNDLIRRIDAGEDVSDDDDESQPPEAKS